MDITQRKTGTEQRSDNTYVRKPTIVTPIEQSVNGVKWSNLDFKTRIMNSGNRVNGYPTEKGLEIVSPEFDLISGARGLLNVAKATNIPMKLKSTYYNKAPWTFKPNPDSYYRAIPKEAIDDAIETGVIRHKPKSSKFLDLLELKNSPDPEIASKASLEFSKLSLVERMNVGSRSMPGQTYFMKGRPLTRGYAEKYNKPVSNYGDYFIEASDNVPFIPLKTKGRLVPEVMKNLEKNYNPEIKGLAIPKANVLPEKVIPLDENVKLYKPDWFRGFKEIKTRKYQSGGSFKSQLYAATNRSPDGRPLEQGLKNVYPEMALAGFVRAGMMGALPSFKNSAISTASGITSREVKDKIIKGLEQATNTGWTINDAVRNTAKTIVIKTTRPIVKQLPERMQMPASRAIGRAWNIATAPYGINGQIAAINNIVNE